jgi:hypothetical protein
MKNLWLDLFSQYCLSQLRQTSPFTSMACSAYLPTAHDSTKVVKEAHKTKIQQNGTIYSFKGLCQQPGRMF